MKPSGTHEAVAVLHGCPMDQGQDKVVIMYRDSIRINVDAEGAELRLT